MTWCSSTDFIPRMTTPPQSCELAPLSISSPCTRRDDHATVVIDYQKKTGVIERMGMQKLGCGRWRRRYGSDRHVSDMQRICRSSSRAALNAPPSGSSGTGSAKWPGLVFCIHVQKQSVTKRAGASSSSPHFAVSATASCSAEAKLMGNTRG